MNAVLTRLLPFVLFRVPMALFAVLVGVLVTGLLRWMMQPQQSPTRRAGPRGPTRPAGQRGPTRRAGQNGPIRWAGQNGPTRRAGQSGSARWADPAAQRRPSSAEHAANGPADRDGGRASTASNAPGRVSRPWTETDVEDVRFEELP